MENDHYCTTEGPILTVVPVEATKIMALSVCTLDYFVGCRISSKARFFQSLLQQLLQKVYKTSDSFADFSVETGRSAPRNRAKPGAKKGFSGSPLFSLVKIGEVVFQTKWDAPLDALTKNEERIVFPNELELKLLM